MTDQLAIATLALGTANTDQTTRQISGLLVPFGTPVQTSLALVTFDAAAVRLPADITRVKLLLEHNQNDILGHATAAIATPDGLEVTFDVAPGPAGDAALASAQRRDRDGLSVGIAFDRDVLQAAYRNPTKPVRGTGDVREGSLVSIPAADNARVRHTTLSATNHQEPTMSQTPDPVATTEPVTNDTATATAAGATASTPTAPAATPPATAAAGPVAAAGAALDVVEPAIYQFNGQGNSLVLDLIHSRDGDRDAADRLYQFNAALDQGDKANALALANAYAMPRMGLNGLGTAAVIKEADIAANFTPGAQLASQLLLTAIDKGRPLVSRCRVLPISNGSPFKVPSIGEFDGVADHTEGTAVVADGTITVSGDIVDPTAVSGSWQLSRELAEATGPRIDLLVVPEMVADYHQRSEVRLVAKLAAVKPAYDTASVDTADELDQSLIDFYLSRYQTPTVVGMGTTAYPLFAKLKASDGRPVYPHYNPTNAAGRAETGLVAIDVQGVAAVPAWSATATDIWQLYGPDVWVFEAAPRTFRFEEVQGPGIIKLAIWGYQAAHIARLSSVRRLKTIA